MHKTKEKAKTVGTVRERESYTLVNKSAVS